MTIFEVENFSGLPLFGKISSGKKVKEEELAKDEIMGLRNRTKDTQREEKTRQWESLTISLKFIALLPGSAAAFDDGVSNRSFEEKRNGAFEFLRS